MSVARRITAVLLNALLMYSNLAGGRVVCANDTTGGPSTVSAAIIAASHGDGGSHEIEHGCGIQGAGDGCSMPAGAAACLVLSACHVPALATRAGPSSDALAAAPDSWPDVMRLRISAGAAPELPPPRA